VPEPGTISVVGQGRASGPPDVCRVDLVATALRSSVAAALADSEQAARRVREALTAGGVAPPDAATSTVVVHAEEDYSGQRGPRLLGYRAEHALSVVLRDLSAAGRVLGEAVAAGGEGVRMNGVSFAVEDDAELRSRAREVAWADALRAGEQLARLAGGALGAVRSVDEAGGRGGGGGGPWPLAARAAGVAEVGLEPGGVDVRTTLAVVWELR
jgi:uncharacterized protein YggE